MSNINNNINNRKISIGIFAHANAGKTTVSEQFLYHSGIKKQAGRVDHGDTSTDSLPIERQRGISVRSAIACFDYNDITIQLIDTPGHVDFSAEVERSMRVLEGAILVISAVEGIQPQTWIIWNALKQRKLPTIIFINKADRVGADISRIIGDIKQFFGLEPLLLNNYNNDILTPTSEYAQNESLSYVDDDILAQLLEDITPKEDDKTKSIRKHLSDFHLLPVFCGSALHDVGITELIDGITRYLPCYFSSTTDLSALVFRIQYTSSGKRNIWLKIYSGHLATRDIVQVHEKEQVQITAVYTVSGATPTPCRMISAGDIGIIRGPKSIDCGDILGKSINILPISTIATPLLGMQVVPLHEDKWHDTLFALQQLNSEDPHLNVRWDQTQREIHMDLMGPLQAETIVSMIKSRYDIDITFQYPTILYREVPISDGIGKAQGDPCSGVELAIVPDASIDDIVFESKHSVDWLYARYQRQVERLVYSTLKQGLYGFPVTHARVILIGGWCDSVVSDPSHYNIAAPLAVMRALKMSKTELWEPILDFSCTVPDENAGQCLSLLASKRSEFTTQSNTSLIIITGTIPASEAMDMQIKVARISNGKGHWSVKMSHYKKAPKGTNATRRRIGLDPTNEELFLMQLKGITKGS